MRSVALLQLRVLTFLSLTELGRQNPSCCHSLALPPPRTASGRARPSRASVARVQISPVNEKRTPCGVLFVVKGRQKSYFCAFLFGFELTRFNHGIAVNVYFLSLLLLICFTITIANSTTATKRSGPVHTYKPIGISMMRFKRFIMLPINKQIEAISCIMLIFFIVYSPSRC